MNRGGLIPLACIRNELSDRIIIHAPVEPRALNIAPENESDVSLVSGYTKTVPSRLQATPRHYLSTTIMICNAPPEPGYHHILQLLNLKLARRVLA